MADKGLTIAIVQRMKKKGQEGDMAEEPKKDSEEMDPGLESAAEEALAAVKKNDAKAFAEAMRSLIECC